MYTATFTTKNGATRKAMKYYTFNKCTAQKLGDLGKGVAVEARDKASAANKIRREYKIAVSASNLRECKSWGEAILLTLCEAREKPAKYSRMVSI